MLTIEQRAELDVVMRKRHGNAALARRRAAFCCGVMENAQSIFVTSLPATTSLHRSGRQRRKLEALFTLLAGPTRIPVWIKAAKLNNKLGGSHWIHLKLPT